MTGRAGSRLSAITISAVLVMMSVSAVGIAAAEAAREFVPSRQGVGIERANAFWQPEGQQPVTSNSHLVARPAAGHLRLAGRQPPDLKTVIGNITRWLVGMLVAVATLFLTIGGIRYLFAGGDPGEVAKAKDTLKYAGIGYCIAVLAPVLVKILQGFVGTG